MNTQAYEIDLIPLDAVRINGGTQSRVELSQATIAEYADAIRAAVDLPPVITFFDGASFWLADGFHRFNAHKNAGAIEIPAEIRVGTQRDAILFSVGANAAHGLRRTNDDKRRAVMTLLNDAEWSTWTQAVIASTCGVSREFVCRVSASLTPSCDRSQDTVRSVQRNGVEYEQKTANIGKAKPADRASAPGPAPAKPEIELEEVEEDDQFGPSENEVAEALAADASQAEYIKALLANEDDPLTKALADVEQMRHLNSVLKSQNDGYQAKINAQIGIIKSLRSKLATLESLERAA